MNTLILLSILLLPASDQPACPLDCEAVIEAALKWVAQSREERSDDIVVHSPVTQHGTTPAHAGALLRVSERLRMRLASADQVIVCRTDHGRDRCRMTTGRVLVRMNTPPAIAGNSAVVRLTHTSFGPDGRGVIQELHFTRRDQGWVLARVVTVAAT